VKDSSVIPVVYFVCSSGRGRGLKAASVCQLCDGVVRCSSNLCCSGMQPGLQLFLLAVADLYMWFCLVLLCAATPTSASAPLMSVTMVSRGEGGGWASTGSRGGTQHTKGGHTYHVFNWGWGREWQVLFQPYRAAVASELHPMQQVRGHM